MITIINEDIIEFLDKYDGPKFHAILTDPPYNLDTISKRFSKENSAPAKHGIDGSFSRLSSGFLGTEWDTDIAFSPVFWDKVQTILYPAALGFSYMHSRTYHRLATALENSGFIIYPFIGWINSQGFPHPTKMKEWEGYYYNRNALKGAVEPIAVFQNNYSGSMKDNILEHGCGAWRIERSRIQGKPVPINKLESWSGFGELEKPSYTPTMNFDGRWPSNIVIADDYELPFDSFFYQAKPSRKEKDMGLDSKNTHPTVKPIDLNKYLSGLVLPPDNYYPRRILIPFAGTMSEAIGAMLAGWDEIVAVELSEEYCEIGAKRVEAWIDDTK